MVRLCLIPFITTTYTRDWELVAAVLLAVSGLTDLLDGFIARRFDQVSDFGKIIDPVADKLTTASVVFALLLRHPQLTITMVVLVLKESAMLIGAYILVKNGSRPAEAKIMGKISTAALYLTLFVTMICDIADYTIPGGGMWTMALVCCVCMIGAWIQYYFVYQGIRKGTYNIETERFEGEKIS